ncbi:hypothetical protein AAFC00_005824 [Neodothiora populina]|uniref:RNA helicase n=1 Tax=Neodothiora populina TaxID=2781224 RepID=A0ABR3P6B7_9PEZI
MDADSEALARAQAHGWSDKSKLDYGAIALAAPSWASDAQVYEWTGDEGEVAPANASLEERLYKDVHHQRAGTAFSALDLSVTQEGPVRIVPVTQFENAGLHPRLLENVKLCGYEKMTAIQAYTIPAVIMGHDIIAIAQTGSGKTAAYLIPVISKLMGKARKLQGPRPNINSPDYDPRRDRVCAEPLVVIVCPTRELAQQIFNEARRLCYRSLLRPVCCYGGVPLRNNIQELGKGCDVLVATPGRLCDLMNKPHLLSMKGVKFTIIDEADEMLHGDWSDELNNIMGGGDANEDADHLYMMFSATFPPESRRLAREYMAQDYVRIRVGRAGSSHRNVKQDVVYVEEDAKPNALLDILFNEEPCRTLVFVNSTYGVENVDDYLFQKGLPTTFMHGKRSQFEREDAMHKFKTGDTPILISTHISGRGIDIANIGHVINYDLPSGVGGGIDEYVHRIGRTGRIGHVGRATSFYNDRNEDLAPGLVNILLETQQPIPDFLEPFKPESGLAEFDDKSDEELDEGDACATGPAKASEEGTKATGGEIWGDSKPVTGAGDWGHEPSVVADDAWVAAPAAAGIEAKS